MANATGQPSRGVLGPFQADDGGREKAPGLFIVLGAFLFCLSVLALPVLPWRLPVLQVFHLGRDLLDRVLRVAEEHHRFVEEEEFVLNTCESR